MRPNRLAMSDLAARTGRCQVASGHRGQGAKAGTDEGRVSAHAIAVAIALAMYELGRAGDLMRTAGRLGQAWQKELARPVACEPPDARAIATSTEFHVLYVALRRACRCMAIPDSPRRRMRTRARATVPRSTGATREKLRRGKYLPVN